MSQKSLGLIETYGLLAGIEAADSAVKSANVELVGYEFAKGSGMTTIKVEGDVGAVKAAVAAAKASVERFGKVAATRVIARPAAGLEMLVRNELTVGYTKPTPPEPPTPPEAPKAPVDPEPEVTETAAPVEKAPEADPAPVEPEVKEEPEAPAAPAEPEEKAEPEAPAAPAEPVAQEVAEAPAAPAPVEAKEEPEVPAPSEKSELKDILRKNKRNKRKG